jgi:hypothetical protein
MLTGNCCGQGGTLGNPVDINPGVVLPFDIPLPAGYKQNIPLIIPVPGQYDPNDIFGNLLTASTNSPASPTTTVVVIYTSTSTSFSTYPVTTTNSIGQQTIVETSSPVITISVGSSTSEETDPSDTGKHTSDSKPRKTCHTIAGGTPLTTLLAHIPLVSAVTLTAGMCLPGSDPLHIPKTPLPNHGPPCYANCHPCKSGACGGDKIDSLSDTGSSDPTDPTNTDDPDNPTDPDAGCENGEGPVK